MKPRPGWRPQFCRPASQAVTGLVALLVLATATGCGGSSGGGQTASTPATKATGATTSTTTSTRSAPRWETVTTFTGIGTSTTGQFSILPGAIQWRARWSCQSGRMKLTSVPPPRRGEPMVDGECTGTATSKESAGDQEVGTGRQSDGPMGYSIITGVVRLAVVASGPWEITIDQQIDTPLMEPPLPAMATAKVLGEGDFYDVEMQGKGTARIYQLADGSRVLRLEDFEVSHNTDLFVWLSEAAAPRTSKDTVAAPHVELGNLKSTLGDQNYVLPADLAPERIRSIVIWCEPVRIAYAASALHPPAP